MIFCKFYLTRAQKIFLFGLHNLDGICETNQQWHSLSSAIPQMRDESRNVLFGNFIHELIF